jgi:hypothetical protein
MGSKAETRVIRAKVIDRADQVHPVLQRPRVPRERPTAAGQGRQALPKRGVEPLDVGGIDDTLPTLRATSQRLDACRRAINNAAVGLSHAPPLVHNRPVIPNDGERYHNGQAIATGFVESTVNEVVRKRFCKKQQMQWSKEGAHLLLQTRVRTLNGELGAIFKRWYPAMDLEVEEIPVAA